MAVDEYFLCCSSWKSQGRSERCQRICMHILLVRYMFDVEVSELLYHVDSCAMIGYEVFMSNCILPANLVNDKSPYASRFLTPISSAICTLIKRALYSATLLEHDLVNENVRGIMWGDKYY